LTIQIQNHKLFVKPFLDSEEIAKGDVVSEWTWKCRV